MPGVAPVSLDLLWLTVYLPFVHAYHTKDAVLRDTGILFIDSGLLLTWKADNVKQEQVL